MTFSVLFFKFNITIYINLVPIFSNFAQIACCIFHMHTSIICNPTFKINLSGIKLLKNGNSNSIACLILLLGVLQLFFVVFKPVKELHSEVMVESLSEMSSCQDKKD